MQESIGVALANIHVLRPHIGNMFAYCKREGIPVYQYLEGQIFAQFSAAKPGKAKRKSRAKSTPVPRHD